MINRSGPSPPNVIDGGIVLLSGDCKNIKLCKKDVSNKQLTEQRKRLLIDALRCFAFLTPED